jgi:hypothetical protein
MAAVSIDPKVTSADASFDPNQPQIRVPRKVLTGLASVLA